jgi:hypothetical protein
MGKVLMVLGSLVGVVSCGQEASWSRAVLGPSPLAIQYSCNGKPPGQMPSGNPAHAPGNSSSNDHDCKN